MQPRHFLHAFFPCRALFGSHGLVWRAEWARSLGRFSAFEPSGVLHHCAGCDRLFLGKSWSSHQNTFLDLTNCGCKEKEDRKSTRLNSSHVANSSAVTC